MRFSLNDTATPWIAHHTDSSVVNGLHLAMNWLYNFIRPQQLKYFANVTRHNCLEKTTMQGLVGGKEAEDSQDNYGIRTSHRPYTFCTIATASRVAGDRHHFRQKHFDSDVMKMIIMLSEEMTYRWPR